MEEEAWNQRDDEEYYWRPDFCSSRQCWADYKWALVCTENKIYWTTGATTRELWVQVSGLASRGHYVGVNWENKLEKTIKLAESKSQTWPDLSSKSSAHCCWAWVFSVFKMLRKKVKTCFDPVQDWFWVAIFESVIRCYQILRLNSWTQRAWKRGGNLWIKKKIDLLGRT